MVVAKCFNIGFILWHDIIILYLFWSLQGQVGSYRCTYSGLGHLNLQLQETVVIMLSISVNM